MNRPRKARSRRFSPHSLAAAALLGSLCAITLACASKPAPEEIGGETMRLARMETLEPGLVPQAAFKMEQGWRITSDNQWGYAAFVPFDGFGQEDVKGTVEMKVQVVTGRLGVGLITQHNELIGEQLVNSAQTDQTVTLPLGAANLQSVVIRSAAPQGTVSEALIHAVDYVIRVKAVSGAAPLQNIVKIDPSATLERGQPVRVVTGQKYGFAAHIMLALPSTGGSRIFVRVHGRVVRGGIGIGILDKSGTVVTNERFYNQAPAALDYFVAIPPSAASVLFRSDRDEKSEIDIEDVTAFRIL
jgi:hypothetical protein